MWMRREPLVDCSRKKLTAKLDNDFIFKTKAIVSEEGAVALIRLRVSRWK